MKAFVALLVFLIVAVLVLAAQSFQSQLFETTYSPPFSLELPAPSNAEGGAPRKVLAPRAVTTSSNPTGFRGPSGPPHIVGPSGPPPGQ